MEIKSWEDFSTGGLKMVFCEEIGNETKVFNFYTKQVITVKDYEAIPDEYVLEIPRRIKEKFLKALHKEAEETTSELIATKKHLEDMRRAFDVLIETVRGKKII